MITAALFTWSFQAPAAASSLEFCARHELAFRTGSESCWALYELSGMDSVCIPRSVWSKGLAQGGPVACGTLTGQWRSESPLLNEPGHEPEKLVRRHFVVESIRSGRRDDPPGWAFFLRVERFRERSAGLLESRDPSGIARRLLLDQRGLPSAAALLQKLGFVHLVAATGIHLIYLAWLWGTLLSWALRLLGIPVRLGRWACSGVVAGTWAGAWLLAGGRPGMLRPVLVLGLKKLASAAGFRWRTGSPLALALILDAAVAVVRSSLHYPAPWAPGRWIYALAVGGGMMAIESGPGQTRRRQHLALALGSWIFPAVIELFTRGAVALATPLLSCFLLPLHAGAVFPALLIGVAFRSQSCSALGAGFMTETVAACAWVCLHLRSLWLIPGWAAALALAIASVARLMSLEPFRVFLPLAVARVLVGGFIWAQPSPFSATATAVEQLDVAQGDAALVYSESGEIGMVDSGSGRIPDAAWLEIFSRRGISGISWVFLTHLDEDHSGALLRIARLLPVGCVHVAEDQLVEERGQLYLAELQALRIPVETRTGGCVPYPWYEVVDRHANQGNRSMSAIRIPLKGGGFYLSAGDADADQERSIGRWLQTSGFPTSESPRILKISHHGSRFSSDPGFLDAVAPTEAWISVGVGNRFGHPAIPTLERLEKARVPIHRTDTEGSLQVN